MRDYREALQRVAGVLKMADGFDKTAGPADPGLPGMLRAIAGGDRSLQTLQGAAAGLIRLLADNLERKPCGVSEQQPELQSPVRGSWPMKLPSGRGSTEP